MRDVAAGGGHSLAVMDDGRVYGWGNQSFGALGNGSAAPTALGTPALVIGLGSGSGVTAVAAGGSHSLALTSSGAVVAWGLNDHGQVGDGSLLNRNVAVPVAGLGSGVVSISAGMEQSLAAKSDGSVWAWGSNTWAELGSYPGTLSATPVEVMPAGSGVVQVSAGLSHSLARTSAGAVWAWGNDGFGPGEQVNNVTTPNVVPTLASGVVDIDGGGNFSLAAKSDGSMVGWGLGNIGRRCSADETRTATPVATDFGTGSGVLDVEAGWQSALVRTADGSVYGCGDNSYNQLGNGSGGIALHPVLVAGFGAGSGATDIASGFAHGLAVASDATPPEPPPIDSTSPPNYLASIGDVTVREGDAGSRTAAATITLDKVALTTEKVYVSATSSSAGSGDFVAFANRGVTIPAGATSATVALSYKGDSTPEAAEVVTLQLRGSTSVSVGDPVGEVTILDDDAPTASLPELSVSDVRAYESDGKTTKVSFTVALSRASAAPVSARVSTVAFTATAGTDFVAKSNAALSFAAGSRFKLVTIQVNNDALAEGDEAFLLSVSNVVGATPSDPNGVGTIRNDD